MRASEQSSRDYQRVARAIRFIDENALDQPTLGQVADHLGLSESHAQRLFTRWAGVSPKRLLQFLTLERAKELLDRSETVLTASWAAGLSGPGRLHDLFVTLEGLTPGEHREGGRGVRIRWGVHPTPFGDALLAATERGLSSLSFLDEGPDPALEELASRWPRATLVEERDALGALAARLFDGSGAEEGGGSDGLVLEDEAGGRSRLRLHLSGTNFQIRVWEALLRIPPGHAATYGDVARALGNPGAARAVGSAVGANPVAFVIPCHRVLRSTGHFGDYRWGAARKRAILAWEGARSSPQSSTTS